MNKLSLIPVNWNFLLKWQKSTCNVQIIQSKREARYCYEDFVDGLCERIYFETYYTRDRFVQRVSNLITNIIVQFNTILFNFIYIYTQIINNHHKLNW